MSTKTKNTDAELDEFMRSLETPPTPREHRPLEPWSWDDLENEPDTAWQVGNEAHPVLVEDCLWCIFGLYKTGKTYYALEQAFCVAFGIPFHGLPVKQTDVAYVIAEGGKKRIQKRFAAIYDKHKKAMEGAGYADGRAALNSGHFHLIPNDVNIIDPKAVQGVNELIAELQAFGVGIVYLDTWASMLAAGGSHASDQQGVPDAIQSCKRVRAKLRCSVVLVAHTGVAKDAQDRPTGMGDLPGQLDGATKVTKEGAGVKAWFRFKAVIQRHTEDGFEIFAQMEKPDGAPEAVLVDRTGADFKASQFSGPQQIAMQALEKLGGSLVQSDDWRDAVKASGLWPTDAKADTIKKHWQRIRAALLEAGEVVESGGTYSISENGSNADPRDDFADV